VLVTRSLDADHSDLSGALAPPGVPVALVVVLVVALLAAANLPGPSPTPAVVALVADADLAVPDRGGEQRAERAAEAPVDATTPTAEATPTPEPVPAPTEEPAPEPEPDPTSERIPLAPVPAGHEVYAGLSTWIDVYDVEWTPEQQVDVAHRGGVDTIFVQSARYASEGDIDDADRLARVIDAAHARGIRVMTWYIPDFLDPERDFRRSVEAIRFTTPNGNRPDGFGLDIELGALPDVGARNERLLRLSAALRDWVGPDYPMAAVVLPPLQLDLNGTWWPGFPYAELRPFYDVYIPMSYSSYRGTDAAKTYQWNLDNITETRRRAGDPDLAVHLAGGIADNLPEVAAFVEAARDGGAIGAGLYDLHTTRSSAWPALQLLRLTPGALTEPVPSLLN
jgi:hypothetical protein